MKQTSTCPKCNSTDIYVDQTKPKYTDFRFVPISKTAWHFVVMDVYACLQCGYSEEYIADADLKDEKKMQTLRKNWKKI